MAICICSWPNTTAPSMASSDRICASDSTISTAGAGARDHQLELRVLLLGAGRVQQVLAVLVAHARGADRSVERQARDRQRGRGAQQRRDVGIDIRVQRHHGRHDLDVVVEAVREQRADGAIDQSRGQCLALGRPAFTLEESARDASRGVGLLDVVDGQRKEIAARNGGFRRAGGHQNHGLAHGGQHGPIGLAREFAGFERHGMRAIRKSLLEDSHFQSSEFIGSE